MLRHVQRNLKETEKFIVLKTYSLNTYSCGEKRCEYYSITKHGLYVHCSVVRRHSGKFSAIRKISRQKLQKDGDGWQWAGKRKQLNFDRLTATSARHVSGRRQLDSEPAAQQIGKSIETDDGLIPVDPAADKIGQRRNITLSEQEKARNMVETDFSSSTVINVSKNVFETRAKSNRQSHLTPFTGH